jgi:hypothetical protein
MDDFVKGYDQAINDAVALIKEKLGCWHDNGVWEPGCAAELDLVRTLEDWRDGRKGERP